MHDEPGELLADGYVVLTRVGARNIRCDVYVAAERLAGGRRWQWKGEYVGGSLVSEVAPIHRRDDA